MDDVGRPLESKRSIRRSSQQPCLFSSVRGRNPLARDPLGQCSRSGFDPLCRGLRTASHLRTLLLQDVGIDDGEVEGVASFLALSVRLQKLDLSENQVKHGHGKHISRLVVQGGTKNNIPGP